MNRRKKFNLKKALLVFMLIGSLLGIQVMEALAVSAEENIVIVNTYSELVDAIDAAQDGDEIGISAIIGIYENAIIGNPNKHITLIRMNEQAKLDIAGQADRTIQNITFDGNEILASSGMIDTSADVNFQNVVFQNASCSGAGGAVTVSNGRVSFQDCIFQNNNAVQGGHIALSNSSIVTIENCLLTSGNAEKGAAIATLLNGATCNVFDSVISSNTASGFGGGIYNNGALVLTRSKVFKNTALVGGNDIANYAWQQIEQDLDVLTALYADENISINGWVADYQDESGAAFLKLDFEEIQEPTPEPTEVILAESSIGIAGDSKITGLESGKCYRVSTDETMCYSKSGGTLTSDATEAELLNGTEIVGMENGKTYMVEEYSLTPDPTDPPVDPTPEPSDPPTESTPDTPDDDKDDETDTPETPDAPGEESSKPDQGNEDNSGSQNPDPTPSPSPDDKEDTPSTPSNSSSSTTNNSSTKDDHSNTRNDYSKTTHTSTVNNNYHETEAGSNTGVASNPGATSQTIVVEKSVPVFAQSETNFVAETDEELPNEDTPDASISKNIRIEANGADCVFELNEDGYNISINANSNKPPESVVADTDSVNWYELVKICLLAAIVVTLFWKSKKPIE